MVAVTVKAINELPVCIEGGTDLSVCSYLYTLYQPCVAMFIVRSVYGTFRSTFNKRSVLRPGNDPFYMYVQETIRSTLRTAFVVRCQIVLRKTKCKRSHSATIVLRRRNVNFLLTATVHATGAG